MNISFLNFDSSSSSGPNSFGSRLAAKMSQLGHTVSLTPSDYNLIFISCDSLPPNSKNILRLDGIWTRSDQIISHNRRIRELYESCDIVVWQSEYDRKLITDLWGFPREGHVIRNGISLEQVVLHDNLQKFRNETPEIFVCASNWHRQKRLKENIEFFQKNKKSNLSKLLILGNNPDVLVQSNDIFYMGALSHQDCLQVYKMADWMLHLAWRDHCPNVVLEALSQKCPVVCASSGGTCELIKNNGIVIQDTNDKNVNSLIFDYDDPPIIDIVDADLSSIKFSFDEVSTIEESTKQYLALFNKLC